MKPSKGDLNNLNFELEDLLSDTSSARKQPKSKFNKPAPKPKPNLESDDFYKKLAADQGLEEISDISDADPNEMARTIEDLDDMDAGLFGPKKSAVTPPAVPKSTGKSDTSPKLATAAGDAASTDEKLLDAPKVKTFKRSTTFDDDDDPLAGLLSDDDFDDVDSKPAPKPRVFPQPTSKTSTPSEQSQGIGSKRLEIDRPPTRSGNLTPEKKDKHRSRQDDVMFDDDDVLGGMGLSSPTTKAPRAAMDDEPRAGGAKSVLDDLLGTSSSATTRPATGEKKGFVLDSRYKTSPKKEAAGDDFSFGSYMPSAAGGSRPNSRRLVRFEDEDQRPKSTPARGSTLEKAIESDSRDWLEMARPSSAGGVKSRKPNEASQQSEAVDWLGLSRLGSPDPSGRDVPTHEGDAGSDSDEFSSGFQLSPRQPTSRGSKTLPSSAAQPVSKRNQSPPRTPPKTQPVKGSHSALREADDWLGKASRRSPSPSPDRGQRGSWQARSKSPPRARPSSSSPERRSQELDVQLGAGGGGQGGDDFLGLGKEVDLDDIVAGKPKSPRIQFRKAEDLFTVPPTRNDMRASLPWDSDKKVSAPRSAPAQTGSGERARKTSLAESPRGLNDSLDALLEAEKTRQQQPTVTMTSSAGAAQQSAIQMQQKQLQQQQHLQQQQQDAARQQLEQQQQQLQLQQQQQLEGLQRQQQQLLEQQRNLIMQPGATSLSGFALLGQDYEGKVKRLELDKSHLETMLETLKTQHAEQVKLLQDSFQKRIALLEESHAAREERLREENELLSREGMDKMRALEKDRSELISSHIRKQQQLEESKRQEVDSLRNQHRQLLDDLHREHDEAIERLKRVKDQEMDAVVNRHSHSKTMQTVMDRVGDSVRELGQLHNQVESSHLHSMTERERSAFDRDQQLKVLQERLERQSEDNAQERARLQQLITKLELQLTAQTRDMEQERWRLRQEESRLRTAQEALDQEKQTLQQALGKERAQLEKAKDRLLDEQKSVLQQIHDERTSLAEERAKFNMTRQLANDESQRVTSRNVRSEIEVESTVKAINNEKERLSEFRQDLNREKARLEDERKQLQQDRERMRAEEERLERQALDVKQQTHNMNDTIMSAAAAREEGSRKLAQARQLDNEHAQKLNKIQSDLAALRAKEKQIAEERLALAREKQLIEKSRDSMLCVNCATPVKDVIQQPSEHTSLPVHLDRSYAQSEQSHPRLTKHAQQLLTSLPSDMRGSVLTHVTQTIEADRSLRMWRINAQKDKAFLNEENTFLQALKHTPYNKTS